VIEDCAQAPGVTYKGRPVGTFGDAGVFSFTETKNITCGEGGMLITKDPQVAFKSRLIRNHGEGVAQDSWTDEELMNVVGMNFRLTELQAAVMIPQLENLDERNCIRKENVNYLRKHLAKFPELIFPVVEKGADYVCFMLKWKYQPSAGRPDRIYLIKALNAEGIPVAAGYGRLMYEHPIFARRIAYGRKGYPWNGSQVKYGPGTCPRSEAINKQFIWFKYINPPNTTEDMEDVVKAFEKI
jgi:dTDP-4-amino-4,6-dideoxygalactose transaminase